MPELPDVEVLRRYVNATSLHKTIESVEVRSPEILGNVSAWQLRSRLTGRAFRSTRRYGKHLFVRVDTGAWLTLHFGMTGRLRYLKDIAKEPRQILCHAFIDDLKSPSNHSLQGLGYNLLGLPIVLRKAIFHIELEPIRPNDPTLSDFLRPQRLVLSKLRAH
ncbi:MAG: DNA-formamidopyrimidine glycosylase family protein [Candidatus Bathyarchaeia archaeon]